MVQAVEVVVVQDAADRLELRVERPAEPQRQPLHLLRPQHPHRLPRVQRRTREPFLIASLLK